MRHDLAPASKLGPHATHSALPPPKWDEEENQETKGTARKLG